MMPAGGARFDDGAGGDNEVQRTMLEIVNQLDGFDARGNVKVRPSTCLLLLLFAAASHLCCWLGKGPRECACGCCLWDATYAWLAC
jgi:hypothetical protein